MAKKLLAIIMAVIMAFGVCAVSAFADDPEYDYIACADDALATLKLAKEGREKATILQPGDKIWVRFNEKAIKVNYYPDVDVAQGKGAWESGSTTTVAFGLTGSQFFTDSITKNDFKAADYVYTVADINSTVSGGKIDFTIAYPEENTFLGWVAVEVTIGTTNTLNLYGVWDKVREDDSGEKEISDFEYIVSSYAEWAGNFISPALSSYRAASTDCVNFLIRILDRINGTETEPYTTDLGVFEGLLLSIKLSIEIAVYGFNSWIRG